MATRTHVLTNTLQALDLSVKVGRPVSAYLQVPGGGKATDIEGGVLFNGQQFGLNVVTNSSGVYSITTAYMGDLTPAGCVLVVSEDGQQVLSPLGYAYAGSITVSSWYPSPVTAGTLAMLVNLEKLNITPSQGQGVRFAISSSATYGSIKVNASDTVVIASDVSGNVTINLVPTASLTPNTTVYSATYPDGSVDYFTVPVNPHGYQGAYAGGTTYHKNAGTIGSPADVVLSGGLLYQCIVTNSTGSAPPSANWQLFPGEPIEWNLTAVAVPGVVALGAANIAHVATATTVTGDPVPSPTSLADDITNIFHRSVYGDLSVRTVTTNTTATATDDVILVDCTSGSVTVTLATAVGLTKPLVVARIDNTASRTVTIAGAGGQTVNGAASVVFSTQWTGYELVSNNANYTALALGGTGGGGSLELTDGTHDLTSVTKITVTGGVVGGTSGAATLTIAGGGTFSFTSYAANHTITTADSGVLLDATLANRTATLPTAVGATQEYAVGRTDGSVNTATVLTTGGQTINGASTLALVAAGQVVVLASDGANWHVVANYYPTPLTTINDLLVMGAFGNVTRLAGPNTDETFLGQRSGVFGYWAIAARSREPVVLSVTSGTPDLLVLFNDLVML